MKTIEFERLYEYLHGLGGVDAADEWGQGWDEAINTIIQQVEDWKEEPVMIVKFQKAILGGDKVLVYDKKETIFQELPMTAELKKLFGSRHKMYRKCTLDKTGFLHVGREVRAHS